MWLPGSFPSGIIKPALSHKCIHISPYLSSHSLPCWGRNPVTWAQALHCKCFCWPLSNTDRMESKIWDPAHVDSTDSQTKDSAGQDVWGWKKKRKIISFQLTVVFFFFYFASPQWSPVDSLMVLQTQQRASILINGTASVWGQSGRTGLIDITILVPQIIAVANDTGVDHSGSRGVGGVFLLMVFFFSFLKETLFQAKKSFIFPRLKSVSRGS